MPLSRVALALEGGMGDDRQRYAGRLLPLEVDTDHGDIRLAEALAFEANLPDGSIRVQPFCLRREQGGDLCLEESMQASAERGQVALAIRGLPMSLIEAVVPEDWELAGATDATLLAEWRQGGTRWQADLGLASELAVRGLDAYGQPWELPPSRLTVSLEANQASADLDLALSLAEAGDLSLVLRIEDPIGSGNLDGRFSLDDFQLSRYRTLMAGMETLEGALEGEVRIGGSREAPVLDGTIGLSGLQVVGGEVPLEVRDGELEVRLAGDQGRINGFVAAEEGRLEIDGDASWPGPDDWRIAVDRPRAATAGGTARVRPLAGRPGGYGFSRIACGCAARFRCPGRGSRSARCRSRR